MDKPRGPDIVYTAVVYLFSWAGLMAFWVIRAFNYSIQQSSVKYGFFSVACLFFAVTIVYVAVQQFRKSPMRFVLLNVLTFLAMGGTLFILETIARPYAPPWPRIGLHGVDAATLTRYRFDYVRSRDNYVGFNSWSQRDRERSISPEKGVYRMAFIGDSFLEESTPVPLSLAVETQVRDRHIEVINLGLTGSAPDEYYYRLKNIALPLQVRHCYVFFYEGNDFISKSTLKSCGLAAVYPRDSLLSYLGFNALNHFATYNFCRSLSTFIAGDEDLKKEEEEIRAGIAQTPNALMPWVLKTTYGLDAEMLQRLVLKTRSGELDRFYDMLRNPDAGFYRSYLLTDALSMKVPDYNDEVISYTYTWIDRMHRLCSRNNVGFTLVVVPTAFQADTRVYEDYLPLADVRKLSEKLTRNTENLMAMARRDGMDVINLRDFLLGQPGAYLNLDGHWSPHGVDVLSNSLARHVLKTARPGTSHGLLRRPHQVTPAHRADVQAGKPV